MNTSSFLAASCRIFYVQYYVICKQFYFFFSSLDSFISFSSLIAMARFSKTMLNNCDENGHLCLLLGLRGNGFSFSPLRMILTVGLSQWLPTQVFMPGEFHGRRSLTSYSLRGHKESDMTEQLTQLKCNDLHFTSFSCVTK